MTRKLENFVAVRKAELVGLTIIRNVHCNISKRVLIKQVGFSQNGNFW